MPENLKYMLKINLGHELKRQDIFGFSETKINPNSIQPETGQNCVCNGLG